ncbi:MAG: leucine--tRNA ligase [Pseudomonadota bacterium]|nr:leucine--tRNA ligase [Pseudomonadota bacterium]
MNAVYDPHAVETGAQKDWDERESFRASVDGEGEKFYCLAMFPYPSGRLHMGHVRCYTLADVINRYRRLKGYNVMQPMGWDAFGLPAENAAIKNGIPPAVWTKDNIAYMKGQMQRLGFGIDWSREFATCDPDYYHWEQWLFIKLFEKGLVYRKNSVVNWDPVDQTVLANEQVENGRGWRSGAIIERREMAQWFLRITAYAEELTDQLDEMSGWPDSVKSMQRNWIGRSEGVEIDFAVEGHDDVLTVFTTRPDTLLGATYVAVAAEHPLAQIAAESDPIAADFIELCKRATTAEADLATADKAGVATEIRVTHPLTGASLPVWVANFVLMEYGSGAVMSVPGHDQRDWEFAKKYDIPIVQVIEPLGNEACDMDASAFVEYGRVVNSGEFDGLDFDAAFDAIGGALEAKNAGRRVTHYRLRDWGVSRQRYWGCPIPMIHCDACGVVPVPEENLPVVLPTDVKFEGVGSPLTTMESFLNVDCPSCGSAARRETDTFDTFMESSWYYARFACPDAESPMVDERVRYWAPVDHYVGGIEHAILHLLYARFYYKLMRDEGLVDGDEPFHNLLMLGMVLHDGKKMSKSAGDAGDPQKLLDRYGADTVRTAMMFAAPPDQSFEWSEAGLEGAVRFLKKLWNQVHQFARDDTTSTDDLHNLSDTAQDLRRKTHETLKKADDDFSRRVQFNTVVSGVMELCNEIGKFEVSTEADRSVVGEALRTALLVISPVAPHIAHSLWATLGQETLLVEERWPLLDESALTQTTITMVVQVQGKVRGQVRVAADASKDVILDTAKTEPNVIKHIDGKEIVKEIVVPDKLVNIVVR